MPCAYYTVNSAVSRGDPEDRICPTPSSGQAGCNVRKRREMCVSQGTLRADPEEYMMRREELFNRGGYYRFLLECNVLLHREAAAAMTDALAPTLRNHGRDEPMKVLDLACGGWPTSIAGVTAGFPEQAFQYTGVDINPDQVELASTLFPFPDNVGSVRILEGNAWDLERLPISREYDLIYSGMNLHHGTPEELLYLGRQLRGLLASDGLLLSHDVYRPDAQSYRRRPDVNPDDAEESFALIESERLAGAGIPLPRIAEDTDSGEPAWRTDYLARMGGTLLARGGDARGTQSTVAHMRQRDYPVSTQEMSEILARAGFTARIQRFDDSGEPMAPYVALCVAQVR